jgi:hypothetical protein
MCVDSMIFDSDLNNKRGTSTNKLYGSESHASGLLIKINLKAKIVIILM